MPIQILAGDSLEKLADQLATNISQRHKSVFQPVYVVTQTEGMNSWLKVKLAQTNGIAANIIFLKPNELIGKIYFRLGGSYKPVLSSDEHQWIIFRILADEDFVAKFPFIAAYYAADTIGHEAKRLALSKKIADLFDQYQIYRREMILKWNKDEYYFPDNADEKWQQYLWRASKRILQDKFPDKTEIASYIENQIKDPDKLQGFGLQFPIIYFFGLSLITDYHLHIFQQVAKSIHLQFLILNPALGDYWFEDINAKKLAFYQAVGKRDSSEEVTGNTLLLAWGKLIQDSFSLLFKDDAIINNYVEIPSEASSCDSLLHKIQHSINSYSNLNKEIREDDLQDGSIVINACYNPIREVQALYNYLVRLFIEKTQSLSVRDVVVMVSNIDLYAAYIQSVFDNAPYKFRYTIADERYSLKDNIANALQALLNITEQNFDAESLAELLDYSSIRKMFKLTNPDLIRRIIRAANIRFGIDGNAIDDTKYVSWKYGIKRIMFGICMADTGAFEYEGETFYPINEVEGFDRFEVTGFVYLVESLIDSIEKRKRNRSLSNWAAYVEEVLHNFVCEKEENNDEDYLVLIKKLESYNLVDEVFNEPISYDIFIKDFLGQISQATQNRTFAQGGITFCSFIPMRSIPFKVVALLGMDAAKFPRKDRNVGFNLMEIERKQGDRSIKENDNHLFLETLLSAKENFYISYTGQSVKDNSAIPPSIVVDELLDYIQSAMVSETDAKKQLIQLQPLHNYSRKYNRENEKLYNYLLTDREPINFFLEGERIPEFSFDEIDIHEFQRFLSNPLKGYFNRALGIYYNEEEVLAETTEKFSLNPLEISQLKNKLLEAEAFTLETIASDELKRGNLPLKNMARAIVNDTTAQIEGAKENYEHLRNGNQPESIDIDLTISNSVLKGKIDGIFGDRLIITSFSARENKHLFRGYLYYLIATASGKNLKLTFISKEKGVHEAEKLNREESISRLAELIAFYKDAHKEVNCFFFEFETEPAKVSGFTAESFQAAAVKLFENEMFPCHDAYASCGYRVGLYNRDSAYQAFQRGAELLLHPLVSLFPNYNFKKNGEKKSN